MLLLYTEYNNTVPSVCGVCNTVATLDGVCNTVVIYMEYVTLL